MARLPANATEGSSSLRRSLGRIRDCLAGESGFTMIEYLVACVIVGVLAGIAIPSLIGQKDKGTDAQAKVLARTAATAAEVIASDNSGGYEKVTLLELNSYEPGIDIAVSASHVYLSAASGDKHDYSVTAKATDGNEFKITRNASGQVTRDCASPVTKTGCTGGEAGSW